MRPNLIFGEESYLVHFLTQQLLTGRIIYPRAKDCTLQKYFPIHMNDVVSCIVHALENPKVKGLEYAIRGSTATSFDDIIDILAKHCGVSHFVKCPRNYITGFFEEFIIGRTHDKNMMKMAGWHEVERQNYKNDWNYLEKFKIKESQSIRDYYVPNACISENYIEPHLYKYKRIALD